MNSLFISVHLDDAVFSCGKLLAIIEHPTVLTVFGGMPKNPDVCTSYDAKSGFSNAEEAILARRAEDAAALTVLGAEQKFLEIPENQYGEKPDDKFIEETLLEIIEDYDEIYVPMGMLHPDHELLGDICKRFIQKDFYVYMDLPYYVDKPEMAVDRIRTFQNLEYEYRGGDLGKKMLAIACYKSQVPIVNLYHLMCDERFYKVTA